jgi:ABC-type branched-subunit amino acid transport system substrate-binding protein
MMKSIAAAAISAIALALASTPIRAEGKYGPGASDTEVKIGQSMPFSGPLAALSVEGKVEQAYLQMINEKGGVRGRKITLLQRDDAYSPAKAVEQTRKLVEGDEVLGMFGSFGTSTNLAVRKYLNEKHIPQLMVVSGVSTWDSADLPWSMSFLAPDAGEGEALATYLRKSNPNAKVGVLYQNDDLGKEYLAGFRNGLGDRADGMIVKQEVYNVSDPSVDSQIVSLQASGADTFYVVATGKFGLLALRKTYDIGWKPQILLIGPESGLKSVMNPLGPEKSIGAISTSWLKDPGEAQWTEDKDVVAYREFMKKYAPDLDPNDQWPAYGYIAGELMVKLIERCGDELTRENLMKQATTLADLTLPLMRPGTSLNNNAQIRNPVDEFQVVRFDGKSWGPTGETFRVPGSGAR